MMNPFGNDEELATAVRDHFLVTFGGEWCRHAKIKEMDAAQLMALVEQYKQTTPFMNQYFKDLARTADDKDREREQLIADGNAYLDMEWGIDFPKIDPVNPRTFADFDDSIPGAKQGFDTSMEWSQGVGPGMLVLSGAPGAGKTHLLLAVWSSLTFQGRDVFYRTAADLMREIQGAIDRHNVDDVVLEIQQVPWLLIDDYGAEATGQWGAAQMDSIIDARWANSGGVRTMLTTNLKGADMPPRIRSRLQDKSTSFGVNMYAPDYRRQGAK